MSHDQVTRHFFNGFIRLHILYHASKAPIYGAEIIEELNRHGYQVSSGTMYPTLRLLQELGYLRIHVEMVNGRRRMYYRATSVGKRLLRNAREKLVRLVAEVIEDQDQSFQVIRKKGRQRQG
jgi:DNA-binding PadR family transcriptional regulator